MSFAGLNALQFWLGLGALAALLAALQNLRVRHREVQVVTTLFWQQALEQTRARVFRQRFRHAGTWLFLLLICGLLWLALARPSVGGEAGQRTICLLDASADMARGTRFADARARLQADVAGLPAATTEVLLVGDGVQTLLAPGEDRLLLAPRLHGVVPRAAPARLGAVIEQLKHVGPGEIVVRVYGDGALPAKDRLASSLRVVRVATGPALPRPDVEIASLGMAEASSGAWDRVDVLVGVRARKTPLPVAALQITLDDQPLRVAPETEALAPGQTRWRYRDLPARGQRLQVRLAATDEGRLDDTAILLLPDRPVLRVFVTAALRGVLAPLLDADPGLRLVASDAEPVDVWIGAGAAAPPGEGPALWFEPATAQRATIQLEAPLPDAEPVLRQAQRQLALAQIDGAALAQATGRTIEVRAEQGPRRLVRVWRELLEPELGFVSSRAFPLFVAGALRWLAAAPAVVPYVAAGEVLPAVSEAGGYTGPAGESLQPLGAAFLPPVAGRYEARDGGATLIASLLEAPRAASLGAPHAQDDAPQAEAVPTAPGSLPTLLILLALVLLALEWVLVRTGRMP